MEYTLERGALYVVGTPIGNLGDFSPRARETLEQADFVAAEDTRVTLKLLNHFGIKKPLVSYFEHNKLEHGPLIVARLQPGETLVAACAQAGVPVYVVPGPTAALSALAISGLPTGRFTFEGFVSVNKRSRREHLDALEGEQRTMIFYEAPHKLRKTLSDFAKLFGPDRRIALCRELTKVHEEVWRTTVGEAAAHYRENEPRGEFVLVVEGAQAPAAPDQEYTLEDAVEMARSLAAGGLSASEAAKEAAKETGFKKGEIYRRMGQDGN